MRARSKACPVRNCTPGHSTSAICSPCCARHASISSMRSSASPPRGASSMQLARRLEAVPGDLRGDRVPVGGEGSRFDEDARTPALRPIEARQHQVQVDRQRVHGDDFVGMRAGQGRQPRGQILVVGDPGAAGVLVALDAEPRPVIQLLGDQLARGERQQAQGVAAQVRSGAPACVARQREARAERRQRVGGVAGACLREPAAHRPASVSRYKSGRLGTASPPSAGTCSSSR